MPLVSAISGLIIGQSFATCQPNESVVFDRVAPSIVTVSSMVTNHDLFSPSFILSKDGEGSGFSFRDGKYVVTNAHVIHDADSVLITNYDGNVFEASVVGQDPIHDIALLEVEDKNRMQPLHKCTVGANIGDHVLAIGNPFGMGHSLTSGIISGVNRSVNSSYINGHPLVNLLQTDTTINPGNSGGPLLSANRGCIVGVNTALLSPNGTNAGIGLAIPVDAIDRIVNDIILNRPSSKVQLGITVLPDSVADLLGIKGVIVRTIIPGSYAELSGIVGSQRDELGRPVLGDIICGINNIVIRNNLDLYTVLDGLSVGDRIVINVMRTNGIEDVQIVQN